MGLQADSLIPVRNIVFQVMYMYYLLGYKLFGREADFLRAQIFKNKEGRGIGEAVKRGAQQPWSAAFDKQKQHFGKSAIFDLMEQALLDQVCKAFFCYCVMNISQRRESRCFFKRYQDYHIYYKHLHCGHAFCSFLNGNSMVYYITMHLLVQINS